MNKSAALFISVILLTQIASYSFNEIQTDLDREEFTADESWEVSGRNNSTGNNSSSNNDSHCLEVGNFSINSTYFFAIDLINTCDFAINYPGINASTDNPGVSGFYNGTSWWYVIGENGTYNLNAQLEFDSSVLNGTIITLDFEASILNCGKNGTWHDCPDSQNSTRSYQFTFGNNTSGNATSMSEAYLDIFFEHNLIQVNQDTIQFSYILNNSGEWLGIFSYKAYYDDYEIDGVNGYLDIENPGIYTDSKDYNIYANEDTTITFIWTFTDSEGSHYGNDTLILVIDNDNTDGNNSSNTIPTYYFDESYGLSFNMVSSIMNGTYVPATILIDNYNNYSSTIDHMLAITFHSNGHSELEITQYVAPPVSRNTISVSQYVYITFDTTYVEVSMDVLACIDEYCDLMKSPEDRYYPADNQYYQSYNSTDIPIVVELSDEIFDLETMTEEEQQNGKDIPRFTFEMDELEGENNEIHYRIVVTSCQMDFATHHIFVEVHWSDDSGAYGSNKWNLADPNRVYGFYPGNSDSTVTFLDQIDYNGGSVVSTFGVGDIIFIKSGFENGTTNDMISITYDMYPAEDDNISLGAVLRTWDFGGSSIIEGDDKQEDNTDENDTDDDSESSGLPSIGVFGTLAAIAVSFVAVIRREQEE